jgi:anti-sigma28 factor (negative regulator of flagellin synthesis)
LGSVLFYGISQRLRKLRDRVARFEERTQTEGAKSTSDMSALIQRLDQFETSIHSSVAPTGNGSSVNSTIRSKALKMHRLGQSPERIAATLRVPKGEVDLLVKVHKIVMRPYENVPELQGEVR